MALRSAFDIVIDEIEEFLTGVRHRHGVDRVLTTVLFTDIVDSTRRAVELGDERWRELLGEHEAAARLEVAQFGGVIADFAGDGVLASFDGPARGVRCAFALRDRLRTLGVEMRGGLHTGEVERRDHRVAGIGVHIAARTLSLAGAGEVLVSRTVKDLVAGSGLRFVDRGTHALKFPTSGTSFSRWSDRRMHLPPRCRAGGGRRWTLERSELTLT